MDSVRPARQACSHGISAIARRVAPLTAAVLVLTTSGFAPAPFASHAHVPASAAATAEDDQETEDEPADPASDPEGSESAESADTAEGSDADRPLDVVVLVDESGSLSDADVEEETQAASTIAQSINNPGSRVTVVGFGSDIEGGSTLRAARDVCRPTVVDEGTGRQYLADCVSDLRRRESEEGNDTDHAEALRVALEHLDDGPDGAMRIVFLLTDGTLDVPRNDQYGDTPAERREGAEDALDDRLARARDDRVQIWPLGFGSRIDRDRLDDMAASGHDRSCESQEVARPTARVAESSEDVVRSLQEALAAASCSGLGEPDSDVLGPGDGLDLTVEIPVIATEGTLVVNKNDPAITVEYVDPAGVTVPLGEDEYDGSAISHSGRNSAVEVLHIGYPRPGAWTVRLTSPPGGGEELVTATAQWQGRIRATLTHGGEQAPGGDLDVHLTLRTRDDDVITDPEAFEALDFALTADGLGLDGSSVEVRDDGAGADPATGDGEFSGVLTLPDQEGTLHLTGTVRGPGVAADQRTLSLSIARGGPPLGAAVAFDDVPGELWTGMSGAGEVTVTNNGTEAEEVALTLNAPAGVDARLTPATVTAEPGGTGDPVAFTYEIVGVGSPGAGTLEVVATDVAGTWIGATQPLHVQVREPPGLLERYWWAWTALLVLAVVCGVALFVWRDLRLRAAEVRGLVVELRRSDGEPVGNGLRALSGGRSTEFPFVIRADGADPRLEHPARPREPHFTVTRDGPERVRLRSPDGRVLPLRIGALSEAVHGRLGIHVSDSRRGAGRGPRPDGRRVRTARNGRPPGPGDDGPRSAEKDVWI
ncbi:VWA domain-containing protein [Nocardiopsis sp. NPDC050513]|uniref:VWA domain-containing protein n=1 Tax=Nocardiopsis sp. NPDC050513 TaxID=3364338 RepID=UPI0037BCC4D6